MIPTPCQPSDIGIIAMDIYFPPYFVMHEELEKQDGVAAGKYTGGLGLSSMAVCMEDEDVYSMSLTGILLS